MARLGVKARFDGITRMSVPPLSELELRKQVQSPPPLSETSTRYRAASHTLLKPESTRLQSNPCQ
eukprot:5804918-Prymnesium_polylepis.2